jgi:hypothetical protein
MHTDATLAILDDETTVLGHQLREFQDKTCSSYATHELKREAAARKRRQTNRMSRAGPTMERQQGQQRRPKSLNLQTYKFHSIGDYVATIRHYGTTDSYTSAIVSATYQL